MKEIATGNGAHVCEPFVDYFPYYAREIGGSRSTAERDARTGLIPTYKVGGRVKAYASDFAKAKAAARVAVGGV